MISIEFNLMYKFSSIAVFNLIKENKVSYKHVGCQFEINIQAKTSKAYSIMSYN